MNELEISAGQARELTDRIKVGVEAIWELIKQAYQSRAWAVLGYDSWDDYCTREFGTSRIKLPREERQEVVASMREIGMSHKAISGATGLSTKTIQREVRSGQMSTPSEVLGTDGKTYAPRPQPEPEPEPTETPIRNIITQDDLAELNQPIEKPETHNTEPRAEAITSQFTSAIADLNRVLNKFDRITRDKNYPRNKEKVAAMHRNDLIRAIDELQTLVDNTN